MTALTGARLSALARCPRQCAYTALGVVEDDPPVDMTRFFARGHLFNMYVKHQLAAKHGAGNVRSEVDVPWPLGTGHADHVVDSENLAVEVVSTVSPSAKTFEFKARQVKSYMRFGGWENGAVYVIDPSSLKAEDVLPVKLTDEDREEIDRIVPLVATAIQPDIGVDILPRVCSKPGDARQYLCAFASTCFKGWEPPAAGENDQLEARRAALDLYQAKQRERNLKAQLSVAEDDRKAAQSVLSELLDPGETRVGPFVVKRTVVKGRTTVRAELLKSGLVDAELIGDYVKVGDQHERYEVTRDDDAPALSGDDFGPNPLLDDAA